MTTVLCGSVISVVGLQNFHPAISGLHLPNSNPEVGELAVRRTAGRIAALVAGRLERNFWICQRKGREGDGSDDEGLQEEGQATWCCWGSSLMTNTTLPRYRNDLTAELVRDLLDYAPESGIFIWKKDRSTKVHAGDIAGSLMANGYVKIGISSSYYLAHRLAWLWVTGEWPQEQIDHINRVIDDNRWVNLREATGSQNVANQPPRKLSELPRGVRRTGRKFGAHIGAPQLYLGTFDTVEEASAAYMAAARDLYGEFYSET
jgi:hypothetical protein